MGVIVREIKLKMVRDFLRVFLIFIIVRLVEIYVDVFEYCLLDIWFFKFFGFSECDILVDFDFFFRVSRVDDGSFIFMVSIRGLYGIFLYILVNLGVDVFEMMISLGKVLFDFGRGVVEDMGKIGGLVV